MRIGVGLSIPELATRGGKFSPASLFTGGAKGVWYSPDDYSTLFQDSAGTTPVTAVEQPVGLMLDKSQGLVLGPEAMVLSTPDFLSGATASGFTVTSTIAGTARASFSISGLTVGRYYRITGALTGGVPLLWDNAVNLAGTPQTTVVAGVQYLAATATTMYLGFKDFSSTIGKQYVFSGLSVKELPGNHASQSTAASRPVLRARYNLLTYSEQFDNAAWTRAAIQAFGSGSVANAIAAPDGTTTADLIAETATSAEHGMRPVAVTIAAAYAATSSISVKAKERNWIRIEITDLTANTVNVWFNAQTGAIGNQTVSVGTVTITSAAISPQANGFYRCSVAVQMPAGSGTTCRASVYLADANGSTTYLGDGTSGLYVWGADLRTGSSAGTYQRIAAATDYATAGFLPYIDDDGTDDSFGTNSIDFSATNKMFVCVGLTKLGTATGFVVENSAASDSNNGCFGIGVDSGGVEYYFNSRGTALAQALIDNSAYQSPVTNVVTAISDISTPVITARINGAQIGTSSASQGTGNFGNYPLYIGRRNNATFPFKGRIYQLIVCGKTLSAAELASTEAFVNAKTGAY